jgi:hypothetical protein
VETLEKQGYIEKYTKETETVAEAPLKINIVVNWLEELKQGVPVN